MSLRKYRVRLCDAPGLDCKPHDSFPITADSVQRAAVRAVSECWAGILPDRLWAQVWAQGAPTHPSGVPMCVHEVELRISGKGDS